MKPESTRPITLEDLLRLKRAERPPAEFWSEFDRNLRAKQLAALVEKRPWWRTLPRLVPTFSRFRLPLGASAILALGFLTFRTYQVAPTAQGPLPEAKIEVARVDSAVHAVAQTSHETRSEVGLAASAAAVREIPSEAPATVAVDAPVPGEISRVISLGGATKIDLEGTAQSGLPGYVSADLAAAQAAVPAVTRGLFASASGFESRAMPPRAAVEPLQQMTPPGDTRRSRLFTAMVSSVSLEASSRTSERAANRIAEEQLYDRVHRFDTRGNAIKLKL